MFLSVIIKPTFQKCIKASLFMADVGWKANHLISYKCAGSTQLPCRCTLSFRCSLAKIFHLPVCIQCAF